MFLWLVLKFWKTLKASFDVSLCQTDWQITCGRLPAKDDQNKNKVENVTQKYFRWQMQCEFQVQFLHKVFKFDFLWLLKCQSGGPGYQEINFYWEIIGFPTSRNLPAVQPLQGGWWRWWHPICVIYMCNKGQVGWEAHRFIHMDPCISATHHILLVEVEQFWWTACLCICAYLHLCIFAFVHICTLYIYPVSKQWVWGMSIPRKLLLFPL